jgi:predicted negative regulator of RcsB-dependent stress response
METEPKARKEIIQLNGLTILVVMALVANVLIVGFVYRFHQWKLFQAEKAHNIVMKELLNKEHEVKEEVTRLEGAPAWNETAYAKMHGTSN